MMLLTDGMPLPAEVDVILASVLASLNDNALGVYLFGSSLIGGMKPDSDLDILVLTQTSLPLPVRRTLVTELLTLSKKTVIAGRCRPIEITIVVLSDIFPWRYPPQCDFVFGEWLRDDFEAGLMPLPTVNPDLVLVLATALQQSKTLFGLPLARYLLPIPTQDIQRAIIDSLPELIEGLPGDERNVILTLARMWCTLVTNEIVSKDNAAQWWLRTLPACYRPALMLARDAYLGRSEDVWTTRERDVNAFVDYARQQIEERVRFAAE